MRNSSKLAAWGAIFVLLGATAGTVSAAKHPDGHVAANGDAVKSAKTAPKKSTATAGVAEKDTAATPAVEQVAKVSEADSGAQSPAKQVVAAAAPGAAAPGASASSVHKAEKMAEKTSKVGGKGRPAEVKSAAKAADKEAKADKVSAGEKSKADAADVAADAAGAAKAVDAGVGEGKGRKSAKAKDMKSEAHVRSYDRPIFINALDPYAAAQQAPAVGAGQGGVGGNNGPFILESVPAVAPKK